LSRKSSPWHVCVALFLAIAGADGPALGGEAESLRPSDRETLLAYAKDTWKSVAAMAAGTELPADGLRRLPGGSWQASPKTTPTDIASYLWSTVAARKLGIISEDESLRRLGGTLSAVERMERSHGFFVEWIDPRTGNRLQKSPYSSRPIEPVLSSVDNAWLATALWVIRNACPSLRERAEALLEPMDFGFFYVPYDAAEPTMHPGLIHGPYRLDRQNFGGLQRILNTEQRIGVYIGIARGQLPREGYYRHARTLSLGQFAQSQDPAGEYRTYMGIRVFEGHYRYRGMRIVPSWGGSMFEALMVTLFVPEETWAPRSWGVNHRLYVRAQIEHGLEEARYGFWGFSPAVNPQGGYRTYGVDALGTDPDGYLSGNDDRPARSGDPRHPARFQNGVVTPHASFLALRFAPRQAMDNLAKLKQSFPVYGEYGFMDSVNVSRGIVSDMVLVLDQGMIMAAIANALADDAIRHAFSDGLVEGVIRPLIEPEEFTAGEDSPAPRGQ
jgi:hypothetical protein